MDDIPAERVDVYQNKTTGEFYRIYPDDPVFVNPDTGQKFLRPQICLNCFHPGQHHILKKGLLRHTSIICEECGCKNFVLMKYCLYCGQEEYERFPGLLGPASRFDCLSGCECDQCVYGTEIVDCPRCEGTGDLDSGEECPTCKHAGRICEADRCSECGTFECEDGCECDWCLKRLCKICREFPCSEECRCADCISEGIAPECNECGKMECTDDCICGSCFIKKKYDQLFVYKEGERYMYLYRFCIVCDKKEGSHTKEGLKECKAEQERRDKEDRAYRHSALPKGFKPKES